MRRDMGERFLCCVSDRTAYVRSLTVPGTFNSQPDIRVPENLIH